MSKADQSAQREQRLAAKLRENLKRRKAAAKAIPDSTTEAADEPEAGAAPGDDPVDR